MSSAFCDVFWKTVEPLSGSGRLISGEYDNITKPCAVQAILESLISLAYTGISCKFLMIAEPWVMKRRLFPHSSLGNVLPPFLQSAFAFFLTKWKNGRSSTWYCHSSCVTYEDEPAVYSQQALPSKGMSEKVSPGLSRDGFR